MSNTYSCGYDVVKLRHSERNKFHQEISRQQGVLDSS